MKRAIVLGAGRVGGAAALDLARTPETRVSVADCSPDALAELRETSREPIETLAVDLSRPGSAASLVEGFNVVVSALPAGLALPALRAVIESNRLVADAGAPVDDAARLDDLAVEMEVAACVGCDVSGLLRIAPALTLHREPPAEEEAQLAGLLLAALARRLLTGDFRGHWGVWTPERLRARVGMAHGLVADLRKRGALPPGPT